MFNATTHREVPILKGLVYLRSRS